MTFQETMQKEARLVKELADKKREGFSLERETAFLGAQAWFKKKYNRDWKDFIPVEELKGGLGR